MNGIFWKHGLKAFSLTFVTFLLLLNSSTLYSGGGGGEPEKSEEEKARDKRVEQSQDSISGSGPEGSSLQPP